MMLVKTHKSSISTIQKHPPTPPQAHLQALHVVPASQILLFARAAALESPPTKQSNAASACLPPLLASSTSTPPWPRPPLPTTPPAPPPAAPSQRRPPTHGRRCRCRRRRLIWPLDNTSARHCGSGHGRSRPGHLPPTLPSSCPHPTQKQAPRQVPDDGPNQPGPLRLWWCQGLVSSPVSVWKYVPTLPPSLPHSLTLVSASSSPSS
jgi:hypothetical protein